MTYTKATLGNDNFPMDIEERKVLGLSWNFHNDEFVIKLMSLAQLAGELSLTKRNILRVIAKVFDPHRDESLVSRTVQMQNWMG